MYKLFLKWKKARNRLFGFTGIIVVCASVFGIVFTGETATDSNEKVSVKKEYAISFLNIPFHVANKDVDDMSVVERAGLLTVLKIDSDSLNDKLIQKINDLRVKTVWLTNTKVDLIDTIISTVQKRTKHQVHFYCPSLLNDPYQLNELELASITNDSIHQLYIQNDINARSNANLSYGALSYHQIQPSSVFNPSLKTIRESIKKFDQQYQLYPLHLNTASINENTLSSVHELHKTGVPIIILEGNTDTSWKYTKLIKSQGLIFYDGESKDIEEVLSHQMQQVVDANTLTKTSKKIQKYLQQKNATQSYDYLVKTQKAFIWRNKHKQKASSIKKQLLNNNRKVAYILNKEYSSIVVNNEKNQLPINRVKNSNLFIVNIGEHDKSFKNTCRLHHPVSSFSIFPDKDSILPALNVKRYKWYNPLVVSINNIELDTAKNKAFISSLQALQKETEVIVINYKQYQNLSHLATLPTVLQMNDNDKQTHLSAAQLVFGGAYCSGKLPMQIKGVPTKKEYALLSKQRLRYAPPEEVGISSDSLTKIDKIVKEAIRAGAFPGCQVFVAHKGNVIFNKSFGHHKYNRRSRVVNSNLYDLSSVTKVVSTTLAMMQLVDQKKIDIDKKLKKYFKKELDTLDKCNIKDLTAYELLIHRSGLQSNMPILQYLISQDSTYNRFDRFFCADDEEWFTIPFGQDLYLRKDTPDSLWMAMKTIRVRKDRNYIYSDLNFNILQKLIEKVEDKSLDKIVRKSFYAPLGLQHTTYNPYKKYDEKYIIPTEEDKWWRKQLVHNYVHDPSAALMGGIAGNAGLFSTAQDLGIIGQMLLNGGTYGGKRFFKDKTVAQFIKKQKEGHRGLGFNKPAEEDNKRFMAQMCSMETYGHTGFAGNCIWVDPKNELVYVFLSNRIHPKASNYKLNKMKIRSRIHQAVYDALGMPVPPIVEEKEESPKEETDTLKLPEPAV